MTPELYRQAADIFDQVCDLAPDRQRAEVDRLTAGNPALARAVAELLEADAQPLSLTPAAAVRADLERLLQSATRGDQAPSQTSGPASSPPVRASMPERIGPYTVTGRLGAGGMGEVYQGRQTNPDRDVAIKLMRPGAHSPGMLRRFRREVQFLGRLAHPGIAQIYDAGVTVIGGFDVPYFSMELVRGVSLTQYADARGLSVPQRLALLASVCDIVQFAHQQGVIHRDLKPANILVADGETATNATLSIQAGGTGTPGRPSLASGLPLPRILDFGIARVADSAADTAATADPSLGPSLATETGQLIGTPGFMSPEQVRNRPGEVDTRSDIYSLGVIGYLLLSGSMPHAGSGQSAFDVAQRTLHAEPPRLGSRAPACRGDIETIIATAMAKDKARRYDSAAELAADIRRYLASQPISARPATPWYLLSRFAARHRLLVGAAAAVAALTVTSSAVIAVLYTREQSARALAQTAQARAEHEADLQRQISDFLIRDTFGAAAASAKGPTVTVASVLDDALAQVDTRFATDAAARGRVRATLANLLSSTGQDSRALEQATRAGQELADAGETSSAMALHTLNLRGSILMGMGRADEAIEVLRQARERCAAATEPLEDLPLGIDYQLGEVLQRSGRHDQAEAILAPLLTRTSTATPRGWQHLVGARLSLAASLRARRIEPERAQALLGEAAAIAAERLPPTDPAALAAFNAHALVLSQAGRHDEAAAVILQALNNARVSFGPTKRELGYLHGSAAMVLATARRSSEALGHITSAVEILRANFDDSDFAIERVAGNAAGIARQAGDHAATVAFFTLFFQSRCMAAGVDEGEGVKARARELLTLLSQVAQPADADAALSDILTACLTSQRSILASGGPTASPQAARFFANLARAAQSLGPAAPRSAARAAELLAAARAALPASQRREEDQRVIDAAVAQVAPLQPDAMPAAR